MTSLASGLGALPIALALGAASKSRSPIGIVIIGGLLFSLILTLYVIPALYTYLSGDINQPPAGAEAGPATGRGIGSWVSGDSGIGVLAVCSGCVNPLIAQSPDTLIP
jgi:hypothetical protein